MKFSFTAPGLLNSELEEPVKQLLAQPSLNPSENNTAENNTAESSDQNGTYSQPSASSNPLSERLSQRGEIEIFFSTFFTIFVAELGDKTQMTTLLMSAESQAPWVVFVGAGTALIATSLLGVLLGRWLASRVSPKTLETATGAILLLVSMLLLWDVVCA